MKYNTPIYWIEKELIKILKDKFGLVKVVDILSKLNLNLNIEHKHPTFSAESLIKLYLYKRVKGITTYPELCKEVAKEKVIKTLK